MIPLILAATIGAAATKDADLVSRTQAFLDAYAADRMEQVVGMVDPMDLAIYGSDASEFCGNVACLRQMMVDDFLLWKTARFGPM